MSLRRWWEIFPLNNKLMKLNTHILIPTLFIVGIISIGCRAVETWEIQGKIDELSEKAEGIAKYNKRHRNPYKKIPYLRTGQCDYNLDILSPRLELKENQRIPRGWLEYEEMGCTNMTGLESWRDLEVKGCNYYFMGKPDEKSKFSTRFVKDSKFFQAWYGAYIVMPEENGGELPPVTEEGGPELFFKLQKDDFIAYMGLMNVQPAYKGRNIRKVTVPHKNGKFDYGKLHCEVWNRDKTACRRGKITAEYSMPIDVGCSNPVPGSKVSYDLVQVPHGRCPSFEGPCHNCVWAPLDSFQKASFSIEDNFEVKTFQGAEYLVIKPSVCLKRFEGNDEDETYCRDLTEDFRKFKRRLEVTFTRCARNTRVSENPCACFKKTN